MIYFTLLPLYPVLCLFALRQVRHQHDARLLTTRHQALISATLVICSLLVMVPFVIEVLAHYQFRHGGGLAVDETVWALWFLLLTGVLSVAVLGRGLWSMGKHGTGSFFAIGAHVLGFLIGVYFLFCTFSHLAFYKLSEGDAGFLNWPLVRDIAPVSVDLWPLHQHALGPVAGLHRRHQCRAWPGVAHPASQGKSHGVRPLRSSPHRSLCACPCLA
jgi:hypothetical protein